MKSILTAVVLSLFASAASAKTYRIPESIFGNIDAAKKALETAKKLDPGTPWTRVLRKIEKHGNFTPGQGRLPAAVGLEKVVPNDRTQPRTADYISVFGYPDQNGNFVATKASMVSERWKKTEEGGWRVEQWILELRMDGALQRAHRQIHKFSPTGAYEGSDRPDYGEAEIIEAYRTLLAYWDAFTP
jgi:hypothetical protein